MLDAKTIVQYLDSLYPNPKPELNYKNDYELLIAVVLSAQTTDKAVNKVTNILFSKYPDIKSLASADVYDLENIIKTIGLYRNKSKNILSLAKNVLDNYGGIIPSNRIDLEKLPGVGRKTCNVFLSVMYNQNLIAVDTHVKRVSYKLGITKESDSFLVCEKKLCEFFKGYSLKKLHLQLVLFGRYKCRANISDCIILLKGENYGN